MRIDNQSTHEVLGSKFREVQEVDRRTAEELGRQTEVRPDETILSDEARLLRHVREIIDELPEVREDKIAALQQHILDGAYQIDEDYLIDALLGGRRTGTESVQ